MNIYFTKDADFITKCVLSGWDWLHDDTQEDPDFYFPPMDKFWVRVEEYGVFLLDEKERGVFECHTALLPCARGKAVEIGKAALEWVFKNTEATKIITAVPENNPMALRMALKSGFKIYGTSPASFKKNGQMLSQTLLEIGKD